MPRRESWCMAQHKHGDEVTYCHDGAHRKARITEVHPETNEVHGIAIYDDSGNIEFGVPLPKQASKLEDRIVNGHFWK